MRSTAARWKITIPTHKLDFRFSRGSGPGGQNLHASNSRCMLKFDINSALWIPESVRESFRVTYGKFISSNGIFVICREDTRSAEENRKLALSELQSMLDRAEVLSLSARDSIEQERVKLLRIHQQKEKNKTKTMIEKRRSSEVKRNRKAVDWE
jgi:protein subunit release factor B